MNAHTHACTRTTRAHAHTQTHTHTHTYARAQIHTHTHTPETHKDDTKQAWVFEVPEGVISMGRGLVRKAVPPSQASWVDETQNCRLLPSPCAPRRHADDQGQCAVRSQHVGCGWLKHRRYITTDHSRTLMSAVGSHKQSKINEYAER